LKGDKLQSVMSDPLQFISRLTVIDKRGRPVKLKPRSEQIAIIEALHSGDDTLVLKARQIGSTTIVAAYFFWKWYTARTPETYVILSHKQSSSQHILDIHRRFYKSLPTGLQRPLADDNRGTMVLSDTGAKITALSAEGKGGLRSFTATALHISEFAFATHADELKATAISALNNGQLCIESTGNHWGDPLHREIGLWESGEVEWNFLFFPWTDHADYTETPPLGWEHDHDVDLTAGQQYWMSRMIGKLGETKFRREYPLSVDDAYAQTDGAWIDLSQLADLNILKTDDEGGQLEKVDPSDAYAIGVDCGAGTGGDASTIAVVSGKTGQLVETRRSRTTSPQDWAIAVAECSAKWNGAKVLVESNGTYGGIIITELKYMGTKLWKDSDGKDWITNASTKPMMLNTLKERILDGQIQHMDDATYKELRSFQVDDRGMPYCPRGGGMAHHGDSVIAMALAIQCSGKIKVDSRPHLPQWIRDRKIQLAFRKGNGSEHRRY